MHFKRSILVNKAKSCCNFNNQSCQYRWICIRAKRQVTRRKVKIDLQNAIDWACGPGNVDCTAIQPSQPCFEPDNLASHASFAFNSYYQQNGASDVACSFGGTGVKVDKDPSMFITTHPQYCILFWLFLSCAVFPRNYCIHMLHMIWRKLVKMLFILVEESINL